MDHTHCESCVSLDCRRHNGCPVVQCKNLCGFSMHECKVQEHLEDLCPHSLVPCVNTALGCELTMERRRLASHVQHCPASVLVCKFPGSRDQRLRTEVEDEALSLSERLSTVTRDPCQLLARRDELSGHIQTYHLDVLQAPLMFQRCPMAMYGCQHKQTSLVPGPKGASIDVKSQCLFVQAPDSGRAFESTGAYAERRRKQKELAMYGYAVEESADCLSQLPVEVLIKICGYLDSLGLWSLARVSYHLRKVCDMVMNKKGITVSSWRKQNFSWVQEPKVSSTPFPFEAR